MEQLHNAGALPSEGLTLAFASAVMAEKKRIKMGAWTKAGAKLFIGLQSYFAQMRYNSFWYRSAALGMPICKTARNKTRASNEEGTRARASSAAAAAAASTKDLAASGHKA
jgi:hypothetical protein